MPIEGEEVYFISTLNWMEMYTSMHWLLLFYILHILVQIDTETICHHDAVFVIIIY